MGFEFDIHKPSFHQSQVDTYLRCGLQFQFRYIDGLKIPPAAALTVGSAVDAAVTHNLKQKIDSNIDLPEQEVMDAYETDFNRRVELTDWAGTQSGAEKDVGAKLTRLHYREAMPQIDPKLVQWEFNIDTGRGYSVAGTADIIEKDGTIEDTKTSSKSYFPDSVSTKLQPSMYSWAYGQSAGIPADRFRFRVLVKPQKIAKEKLQVVEGIVGKAQHDWLFKTIDHVHKAVQAGIAVPAISDSWICSKKWCGYWSICRGKK